MTYHILINTFDAGNRGRQHDMGPSRDIGSVVSSHHTHEGAERAAARLNREVQRGHGRDAYMPTTIRESDRMFRQGRMVCEADISA